MNKTVKFLSAILTIIITITSLPLVSFSVEITDTGTCGKSLSYTLDSNGLLTVSGNGNTIDSSSFADRSDIVNAVIPDGVEYIGFSAFKNCTGLKKITLPDSIKIIRTESFYGCTGLEEVKLPFNGSLIDVSAFYGCESLKKVTVPKNTVIEDSVFENCTGLKSVLFQNGITAIPDKAFKGCTELENITVPDSVKSIGKQAFFKCEKLYDIPLPDSLEHIGTNAFGLTAYCNDKNNFKDGLLYLGKWLLTGDNASIGQAVEIKQGTVGIAPWAFQELKKIESVIIPDSVTTIEDYAFSGCHNLKNVVIPDSITYIGGYAFEGTPYFKENIDENGLFYVGNWLDSAINSKIPSTVQVKDGTAGIASYAFNECSQLESITLPDSVKYIGDYTFLNCENLKEVTMPEKLSSIGKSAFMTCTSLKSITIPEGITDIKEYSFMNCTALENINLPGSLKNIESAAFLSCDAVNNVFYNNTAEKWKTLKIDENNDSLLSSKINCISPSELCTDGHTFTDWQIETPATYESDGIKTRHCTVCNISESAKILKLVATKSVNDEKTGIQLNFTDTAFSGDASLKVETVSKDTKVFKSLSEAMPGVKFELFDISVFSGETKIQPDGNVQICVPVPEGFANASVYFVKDNGETEKITSYIKDGKIFFETNHFSFYAIVNEATVTLGDVNGDTKINTKDARLILRYAAKLEKFTPEQEKSADVNNDTKINTKDARKILRVVAKLETM